MLQYKETSYMYKCYKKSIVRRDGYLCLRILIRIFDFAIEVRYFNETSPRARSLAFRTETPISMAK